MDSIQVRRLIQAAFPDVPVRTVAPFREGWANQTWLVNDHLVFRFPKTAAAAVSARKEIGLMPELSRALPVPVPDFRYAAPNGAPGHPWPFAGYTMIGGTPLADLDEAPLSSGFAASVGDFLSALHAFPVSRAAALGVPGGTPEAWRTEYSSWYEATRALIWPHLAPREQRHVGTFVEDFLQDNRHFRFTPALIHHDLSDDHLLVNPSIGALTGVIDFEDALIGDPAFDFTGVVPHEPGVLDTYRGPRDEDFEERMRFYTRLWPLHQIRYGVESGRSDHIQLGLAQLRKDIANTGA